VIYVLVSSEKQENYPPEVFEFQKPDTGVWSIDYFFAPTVEELDPRKNLQPLLSRLVPTQFESIHIYIK